MMMVLCTALLCVGVATALLPATTPPVPGDPLPTGNGTNTTNTTTNITRVYINMSSINPKDFSAIFWHTAPSTVDACFAFTNISCDVCTIGSQCECVNLENSPKNVSIFYFSFDTPPNTNNTIRFSGIPNGTYYLNVSCINYTYDAFGDVIDSTMVASYRRAFAVRDNTTVITPNGTNCTNQCNAGRCFGNWWQDCTPTSSGCSQYVNRTDCYLYGCNGTVRYNDTLCNAPPVSIIYPVDTAPQTFNVSYTHALSGSVSCGSQLDSATPRNRSSVPRNTQMDDKYSNVPLGGHVINVTCWNSTYIMRASRPFNVTNQSVVASGGLAIWPSVVNPSDSVRINGTFDAYTTVEIDVVGPDSSVNSTNITIDSSGRFVYTYTVPRKAKNGTYFVSATLTDDPTVSKNGTFTVAKLTPYVMLSGNKANVTAGSPFVVVGGQFPTGENLSLTLIGNGTLVNYVKTDLSGEFSFLYSSNLATRSYDLTVRSVEDTSIIATLSFSVVAAPVVVTNTTPITIPNTTVTPKTNISIWVPIIGEDTTPAADETVDTTVNSPDITTESTVEQPTPITLSTTNTDDTGTAKGGIRWWIFLIAFVVIVGGLAGYLVYNGTLDISSIGAFQESVQNLFGSGSGGAPHTTAGPLVGEMPRQQPFGIGNAESQTIKAFIYSERTKGFDDLTIRSALIAKGWQKNDVDAMFDQIYREQSGP
jgi:hypothetical protein